MDKFGLLRVPLGEEARVSALVMPPVDVSRLTFKSLRNSPDDFDVPMDSTGLSPWTENKPEVRGGGTRGGNGARMMAYCLVPCCCIGFLVFAVLGTTTVLEQLGEQDHHANLIGGRMFPSPPTPPPRGTRATVRRS